MNVKRIQETAFNSDQKYMEVRCKDSNKEVTYMKGTHISDISSYWNVTSWTVHHELSDIILLIVYYMIHVSRTHTHRQIDTHKHSLLLSLSLSHTLQHTLTHSLNHSLNHSLTQSLTYSITHSHSPSLPHSLTLSLSLSLTLGALEVLVPMCSFYSAINGDRLNLTAAAQERLQHQVHLLT